MLSNFAMMDFVYEQIFFNLAMQPTITRSETLIHHPAMSPTITRSETLIHRPNTTVMSFYENLIANKMVNLTLQPLTWNYNQDYNANIDVRGNFSNTSNNERINQSMQPPPTRNTTAFKNNKQTAVKGSSANSSANKRVDQLMQAPTTGGMASFNRNRKTTIKSCIDENSDANKTFDIFQELEEEPDTESQDLLEKIKLYTDSLRTDSENYFGEFKLEIDTQAESVESDHAKIANQIKNSIEQNKRNAQLNDVILRGIPYKPNEKLLKLFSQIAGAVGFQHSIYTALNSIFRMSSTDNKNGAPILVRFSSLILKREFLTFFQRKQLQLKDIASIALTSANRLNRRIYARENLTPLNYSIYIKAAKLLKAKQICKFRTSLGLVYVMFPHSDEWKKIVHPDSLDGPFINTK